METLLGFAEWGGGGVAVGACFHEGPGIVKVLYNMILQVYGNSDLVHSCSKQSARYRLPCIP